VGDSRGTRVHLGETGELQGAFQWAVAPADVLGLLHRTLLTREHLPDGPALLGRDLRSGDEVLRVIPTEGVIDAAGHARGHLLLAAGRNLHLLAPDTGETRSTFPLPTPLQSIQAHPWHPRVLLQGIDGALQVFDVDQGAVTWTLPSEAARSTCRCLVHDILWLGVEDPTPRLLRFDVTGAPEPVGETGLDAAPRDLVASDARGATYALVGDRGGGGSPPEFLAFDSIDAVLRSRFPLDAGPGTDPLGVTALFPGPGETWAFALGAAGMTRWRIRDAALEKGGASLTGGVTSLRFIDGARTLLTRDTSSEVRGYELPSGEPRRPLEELREVSRLREDGALPYAVAASADGRWRARILAEGPLQLEEVGTDAPPVVLADSCTRGSLAFFADGRIIAAWDDQERLAFWSTVTRQRLLTLELPGTPYIGSAGIHVDASGELVVLGFYDGPALGLLRLDRISPRELGERLLLRDYRVAKLAAMGPIAVDHDGTRIALAARDQNEIQLFSTEDWFATVPPVDLPPPIEGEPPPPPETPAERISSDPELQRLAQRIRHLDELADLELDRVHAIEARHQAAYEERGGYADTAGDAAGAAWSALRGPDTSLLRRLLEAAAQARIDGDEAAVTRALEDFERVASED
jgi:hypothetical protein